jgi:hypothetical protein
MNNGKIKGKQILSLAVIAKLSTPFAAMHSSPGSYSIENGNYGCRTIRGRANDAAHL